MQLKLFIVSAKNVNAAEVEMNALLRGHRVLAVRKEFVSDGENSFWTFCVEYLENTPTGNAPLAGKPPKVDYRELLKPEEFEVFSRLRVTASTPTGLQRSAQGCEARATLGGSEEWPPTLKGLRHVPSRRRAFLRWLQPRWGWAYYGTLTQGSSCLATLGWTTESCWDSANRAGVLDLFDRMLASYQTTPG